MVYVWVWHALLAGVCVCGVAFRLCVRFRGLPFRAFFICPRSRNCGCEFAQITQIWPKILTRSAVFEEVKYRGSLGRASSSYTAVT